MLLSHLTNHLDDLNIKLSEHKVRKDHEGSAALRFAMIMSFTTLGKLSLTLARHPLPPARNKMEFKRGCSQALTRLSEIVNEQEPMEFREMELFLGVSSVPFHSLSIYSQPSLAGVLDARGFIVQDAMAKQQCASFAAI